MIYIVVLLLVSLLIGIFVIVYQYKTIKKLNIEIKLLKEIIER